MMTTKVGKTIYRPEFHVDFIFCIANGLTNTREAVFASQYASYYFTRCDSAKQKLQYDENKGGEDPIYISEFHVDFIFCIFGVCRATGEAVFAFHYVSCDFPR